MLRVGGQGWSGRGSIAPQNISLVKTHRQMGEWLASYFSVTPLVDPFERMSWPRQSGILLRSNINDQHHSHWSNPLESLLSVFKGIQSWDRKLQEYLHFGAILNFSRSIFVQFNLFLSITTIMRQMLKMPLQSSSPDQRYDVSQAWPIGQAATHIYGHKFCK